MRAVFPEEIPGRILNKEMTSSILKIIKTIQGIKPKEVCTSCLNETVQKIKKNCIFLKYSEPRNNTELKMLALYCNNSGLNPWHIYGPHTSITRPIL